MLLTSIRYREHAGRDQEWILDELTLGNRNLLVGKNATGKSRTLDAIGGLAKLLSAQTLPGLLSTEYSVCFSDGANEFHYGFRVEAEVVQEEQFSINGEPYLQRGQGGVGKIFAKELKTTINFQTPQNELAAVVRRDAIQHPFLQPLHDWGSAVRHYRFGTSLGKERFAMLLPMGGPPITDADDRDASEIVGVFGKAMVQVGDSFKQAVLHDLERMDYPADDVGIGAPVSVPARQNLPGKRVCLWVKEKGLKARTDQPVMSQGMFRVLSLLTLTNYLILTKKAGCIIVDDVGEGIDFDRSCLLIDLLREKSEHSAIQLIAATNDRFVMNKVPLEEWSVLQRKGSRLTVRNHQNARKVFDTFKMMGLNNFDFLRYDFINENPDSILEEIGAGGKAD